MPKLVKIGPNPAFKPADADQKAAFEAAKKKGAFTVPYVTAAENIKRSGGMFQFIQEQEAPAEIETQRLEDKPTDELKVMMLSLGIKTEKQMRKSDIIMLIRKKLDEVEVIEDE